MAFQALQVLPDVYHIQDCMGVCMTLLVGKDRALLVDTGYGLENVREMAASITALPVTVLLTHAHHDHALGARWLSAHRCREQAAGKSENHTGRRPQREWTSH